MGKRLTLILQICLPELSVSVILAQPTQKLKQNNLKLKLNDNKEVILSFFISLNPSQRQVSLANSPPAPSDHRLTNSIAITSVEAPSSFMSPPT